MLIEHHKLFCQRLLNKRTKERSLPQYKFKGYSFIAHPIKLKAYILFMYGAYTTFYYFIIYSIE